MESETPRQMRKVRRNIFHRVGMRLGKLEESLGMPSPDSSRNSQLSLSDTSSNYQWENAEDYDEEGDNVSIQSVPYSHSNTPRVEFHHSTNQLTQSQSDVVMNGTSSDGSWQTHKEEQVKLTFKHQTGYDDNETEMICKDLMENKPARLYECRDYDKKVSLLRMAISFNSPKVTVPVLLFLENTLSKPIFYELIKKHPSAIKNYLNTTKSRVDNDYYIAMLKQFGKNQDVGMIRIRQASEIKDINNKISLLEQAAIETNSHPWWNLQIIEYQHLLRKQRELQKSNSFSQSNVRLENRTLLDTYKILFDIDFRRQKYTRHPDKTAVEHSKELETAFQMSPEMIMCGKLSAIMQCGLRMHYEDFIHQAMHQAIFSRKYVIPPENFADMVFNWVRLSGEGQEKASEKTERFLNMIQSPMRRIYYAEKFQNYDVAMDTIANVLRDRVQLENLRRRIPRDHASFNRATSLLENSKWKN